MDVNRLSKEPEKLMLKKPCTFEEQINIFRNRNLTINDEDTAMSMLKRVNYYRLSAYTLTLKDRDRFFANVLFEDICQLYDFDRKLRNLILGIMESIEVAFRTHIAYELALKYGPLGYEEPNNFVNSEYHQVFINELNRELERSNEVFITHYKSKYDNKFPIWVAVEVTSFGLISKLFSNLKNEDKSSISKGYYNIPYIYIQSWLMHLAYVRNICAHYGRLYNKVLTYKPKLADKDKNLCIAKDKIFVTLYVMRQLVKDEIDWNGFIVSIQALLEQYSSVDHKLIGFPDNWFELLIK